MGQPIAGSDVHIAPKTEMRVRPCGHWDEDGFCRRPTAILSAALIYSGETEGHHRHYHGSSREVFASVDGLRRARRKKSARTGAEFCIISIKAFTNNPLALSALTSSRR